MFWSWCMHAYHLHTWVWAPWGHRTQLLFLPYSIIPNLPSSSPYTPMWARVCGLGALACPGTPGQQACTQRQDPSPLREGGSAPCPPPPPYPPVGVGGWHLPGLDALQGALAPHHHAQVGVPVGIVALGLRRAVGPTGPACGEQPVNCTQEERRSLTWPGPPSSVGLPLLPLSCPLHEAKPTFQDGTHVGARNTNQSFELETSVEDLLCARPWTR